MSRYNSVFNVKSATDTIPSLGKIPESSSDAFIVFNSAERLDLLSYRMYGDPQYWWVILAANGYQIEFDIEDGEILRIPTPLSDVLSAMRKSTNV